MRLACIILILLALDMTGLALAENVADEERVDNGTMDLVTIVHGYLFKADQSVDGTGFANVNNNLASVSSDDGSPVLNLGVISSGSGSYSHNSSIYVQYNVVDNGRGEFGSSNQKITAKEDTSAVYAPMNFQIPGSFRAKIGSLWKDQTRAKNFAGLISMNSLFDNAKTLNKESTNTIYSDTKNYEGFLGSVNSSMGSSMEINSKFDGTAHLGATMNDVGGGVSRTLKGKSDDNILMDEDYRGSFDITKKMAVYIKKTTDYGYYEANYDGYNGNYPWLPCLCNAGWDSMTIHDQRYHSAKGFFDCTTCLPPALCKN